VAAVLVHIDLDGDKPHASSLVALAAGRQVASSWGATLYAALIVHDETGGLGPDSTASMVTAAAVPGIESIEERLSRGGADKLVVALTEAPVVPLWGFIGNAWQGVIDQLRPRVVLFGAESPSALELGPRTGARIGARLLAHARTVGGDEIELRDRDGALVRIGDSGAAVALIGRAEQMPHAVPEYDDIDVVVLAIPGAADEHLELGSSHKADALQTSSALVAIGDDVAGSGKLVGDATRLAKRLGAQVVADAKTAKAIPGAVAIDRAAPLAPDLCVVVGNLTLDIAGASSLVRIGGPSDKTVDGVLPAPADVSLASLVKHLEDA
jgi:hypothetical protein